MYTPSSMIGTCLERGPKSTAWQNYLIWSRLDDLTCRCVEYGVSMPLWHWLVENQHVANTQHWLQDLDTIYILATYSFPRLGRSTFELGDLLQLHGGFIIYLCSSNVQIIASNMIANSQGSVGMANMNGCCDAIQFNWAASIRCHLIQSDSVNLKMIRDGVWFIPRRFDSMLDSI